MSIQELIDLAQTRLGYLEKQRETAVRLGDAKQILDIDREVAETQDTLAKLQAPE